MFCDTSDSFLFRAVHQCLDMPQFILSPVGHLSYLQFGAITNTPAVNVQVHVIVWTGF